MGFKSGSKTKHKEDTSDLYGEEEDDWEEEYDWDEEEEEEEDEEDETLELPWDRPSLLDLRGNMKKSRAAFLGVAICTLALVGLILCYVLPWVTHEDANGDTEHIKSGDFEDVEIMVKMHWWNTGEAAQFYQNATGWATGGFTQLMFLGLAIYLLALYQDSPPARRFFSYFPDSMLEEQRRLFALQVLASLSIFMAVMTLRAVPRFFQLQLAYNQNSDALGTGESIFAGWASMGVLVCAGSILILGLHMVYSILRTGWSVEENEVGESTEFARRKTLSRVSLGLLGLGTAGLLLSLLLPSLLASIDVGGSVLELVVDDGTIYELKVFRTYYPPLDNIYRGLGDAMDNWYASAGFNLFSFSMILLMGLISSLGIHLPREKQGRSFFLSYWAPLLVSSLFCLAILVNTILWMQKGDKPGEAASGFLIAIGFSEISIETSHIHNYVPLLLSAVGLVALSFFLFKSRSELGELLSGLKGEPGDEEEMEYLPAPWTWPREPGEGTFRAKPLAASFACLFLLAGAFGALGPGMGLDTGGLGELEQQWFPAHEDSGELQSSIDENSADFYPIELSDDTIFLINFTLRWQDEADEPFATNDGDEFRLIVEAPWGEEQQSEWVKNEHGEEGFIHISFIRDGEPGPMDSAGYYNVTIECGECGDQWYTNPPTIGQADNGNDYFFSSEYYFWKTL